MAHNLNFVNGKASIAYSGDIPWYGFGTSLKGLVTVPEMQSACGQDYEVQTVPLYIQNPAGDPIAGTLKYDMLKDRRAIIRSDNHVVLDVASDHYRTVQNSEAGQMMEDIGTLGQAVVEVGGVLGKGERAWLLAKLPQEFEVVVGDLVNPYFLMTWGHDGKHAVTGKLTLTRVVCQNTLDAAMSNGKNAGFSIRHSKNADIRISEARKALGVALKQTETTAEWFKRMASKPLSEADSRIYIEQVFPYAPGTQGSQGSPEPESAEDAVARLMGGNGAVIAKQSSEARDKVDSVRETIVRLMGEGRGAEYAPGTVWNAYNAVTEYADHVYPVLQSGQISATKQQSAVFGAMAATKSNALDLAMLLAK